MKVGRFVAIITVLVGIIIALNFVKPQTVVVEPKVVVMPPRERPVAVREVVRSPEFREPPLKEWRPKNYQQVGLLMKEDETLPLYGRESRVYRDKFHYYSSTPGHQIYALPVYHNGRDCMEDFGCNAFYGNEKVSITGREGDYNVKIYRPDQFRDLM